MAGFTFGAQRWDYGWWPTTDQNCIQAAGQLSDPRFNFRAPLNFVKDSNVMKATATQTAFDAEITYASGIGISYWNYLLYAENSPGNSGINLHLSSSIGNNQKYTIMPSTDQSIGTYGGGTGFQSTMDNLVNKYINKSNYFKYGTRPVVFFYNPGNNWLVNSWGGSYTNLATGLAYFRSKILSVTGANPYFVWMPSLNDAANLSTMGVDAVSSYISAGPGLIFSSYATMASNAQSWWTSSLLAIANSQSIDIVPTCITGWDPQPRYRGGDPGGIIPAERGSVVSPTATAAQLTTHVNACISFINSNSSKCPSKIIVAYAWNEHTEGGFLNATYGDPTGTRLSAIMTAVNAA